MRLVIFCLLSSLLAGLGLLGEPAPASVESQLQADWSRQEQTAGRTAGSSESIRLAIRRGRALAEELTSLGRKTEAEKCLRQLAEAEMALGGLEEKTATETQGQLTSADGWHLVRAAVCGAGAPLDEGRVQGKNFTYAAIPLRENDKQPSQLPTVSWDEKQVIYRFTGLDPAAKYRIRALYGVDASRTLRLQVGGQILHEAKVPDHAITERTSEIPAAAIQNRTLEIVIDNVAGFNTIVSALELWSSAPETDPAKRQRLLACRRLTDFTTTVPLANSQLYFQVRTAIRNLLFAHPALNFDELLLVKRHWPSIDHQCAHRVGEAQIPGASLCVLKGLRPDGELRTILDQPQGGIGRPDLSFDGKRIVFPLARPRTPPTKYPMNGGHAFYDPQKPADSTKYRGGVCEMYDIYEIDTDGTGLRQLTRDTNAENTEPCYLPDGRIVFTSSRGGRMVQCGDWALVFGMFTMNPDGSGVQSFTQPQDSEFYPSMLEDGRILFTRWDYVMKAYNVIQQLWVVNPDGTRTQLAYGDWYSFSRGPIALFEARQIPGTRKVVAVGAAHHNTACGPLMLADLNQNRGGPDGLRNLTPEVGYPECGGLWDERTNHTGPDIPPISNAHNATGWYASPWPLSETLFLTCYSFEARDTAPAGHGLYLYDAHGNKELIYRDPAFSCYAPIPFRARPRPLQIPPMAKPARPDAPGTLFVQDVYAGLDGVPRGTVKWLRVCETYPKLRHTNPHRVDVGVGSGYDMRGVLGVVPVEDDGSAYFEVPPGKMVFLEALTADFLEVRRMRNYINLQPGEMQSCVGCHETPGMATPPGARPLAALKPPVAIQPPPWGAGPMRFAKIVQPALDRNCISCHDGDLQKKHPFDLRGGRMVTAPHAGDGDEGPQHTVSTAFLNLLKYVKYVKVTGYAGEKLPLKPYAHGSAVSPLMQMLKKGHHDIKLAEADWQAFAAWIDCNAPYFGSYDDDTLAKSAPEPILQGQSRPFACADFTQGKVFIVAADGKIQWEHPAPSCTDLWVLPNGNLLFTTGHGVKEVTREKKVVFNYESKSEIFACQRLANGNTFVAECQSGSLLELDPAGKTVKQIRLLPEGKAGDHAYIGAARQLANGNYLVAHYGEQMVREYDAAGKMIREIPAPGGPHGLIRLANGNTLIALADKTKDAKVIEVDPAGKIVWQFSNADLPGGGLKFMTGLQRLPNGNTVMSNWLGHGQFGNGPHVLEITPEKKVVWSFADHQTMKAVASVQVLDVPNDATKGKVAP